METIKMWKNTPGNSEFEPVLEYYKTNDKKTNACVIICPGGGYSVRAEHEGKGYAEYLNSIGMDAFVLQYRVSPNRFPLELLDARRSVRWVRYHAKDYEIDPNKICIMGSSAGGHLAALASTYNDSIEFENIDEIDKTDYKPNFQILAYPVITMSDLALCHVGSVINLLGSTGLENAKRVDPALIADSSTPPAFIWHTSNDNAVNVSNSLKYGEKLREVGVLFEMHIFPDGCHGLGLAKETNPYVSKWTDLLEKWFAFNDLL